MEPRELAFDDWKSGMKYKAIAEKYGVTLSAVKSWAARDWKQREVATKGEKKLQPKSKKVATKKHVPSASPPTATIDQQLAAAVEDNEELTDKQRQFCYCYMKNFNAAQAARNAGYSNDTAGQIGYQLLQKTSIRQEITELKRIKNEWLGGLCGADIIEMHMRIAFADITDYIEFKGTTMPLTDENGEPATIKHPTTGQEIPLTYVKNETKLKNSKNVDGQLINEVSQGKDGVKIKLADRQKSLDFLARYFELNPMDRHRKEYDDKKLELELLRLEIAQQVQTGEPDAPESNFLEAMMSVAADVWSDKNDESGESADK